MSFEFKTTMLWTQALAVCSLGNSKLIGLVATIATNYFVDFEQGSGGIERPVGVFQCASLLPIEVSIPISLLSVCIGQLTEYFQGEIATAVQCYLVLYMELYSILMCLLYHNVPRETYL